MANPTPSIKLSDFSPYIYDVSMAFSKLRPGPVILIGPPEPVSFANPGGR